MHGVTHVAVTKIKILPNYAEIPFGDGGHGGPFVGFLAKDLAMTGAEVGVPLDVVASDGGEYPRYQVRAKAKSALKLWVPKVWCEIVEGAEDYKLGPEPLAVIANAKAGGVPLAAFISAIRGAWASS